MEETAVRRSGLLTRAKARARIQEEQGLSREERGRSDWLLPLRHPKVTRSHQESQEGQDMGLGPDVQSQSALFGFRGASVLTPSEFCRPKEYFADAEENPLASNVRVSSPLCVDVGFDEPEGGIETSSAMGTTEPVAGVGTGSSRSRAMEPEVGVDPSMTTSSKTSQADNYQQHLQHYRQRDRKEAEAQETVQSLLHEFEYGSMSLLDKLVMSTPLILTTQEAQARVPDTPPEGGPTIVILSRLLPLLYLPQELPEGFQQAMEWEERLSEAAKRATSTHELACQRISLMKITGT